MNRRAFINKTAIAGSALGISPTIFGKETAKKRYKYNLNYAPHLGMFKNLAGENPIDQLNFMAEQGFTAF